MKSEYLGKKHTALEKKGFLGGGSARFENPGEFTASSFKKNVNQKKG